MFHNMFVGMPGLNFDKLWICAKACGAWRCVCLLSFGTSKGIYSFLKFSTAVIASFNSVFKGFDSGS